MITCSTEFDFADNDDNHKDYKDKMIFKMMTNFATDDNDDDYNDNEDKGQNYDDDKNL